MMSDRLSVDFEDIRLKGDALRSRIEAELTRMDEEYARILPLLEGVDGASAAALRETIEANRQKSRMAALTLEKLISALESSAMQVEALGQAITALFTHGGSGLAGTAGGGGGEVR
ncbi:MAG: hypothetical protein LBR44_08985 [Clostridiales Family XIII bacterium]|jgi:hypothetical protein|nr:hypothetical protein [Clostridiales Family XIII bacterium]